MSIHEAERDARELLASSWWLDLEATMPMPIDPMELARDLGIAVTEDLLPTDESGRIVMAASGQATITLNAFDHPNRKRFTCAHEIGHYSSRRKRAQASGRDQTFTDYRATLAGLGVDREEIYANQFAAALLMPKHLVARQSEERASIEDMARRFGTSTQAMGVRLRNLGLA